MTQIDLLDPQKERMAIYNALDACNTLAISEKIFPYLEEDKNLQQMYNDTISLYEPLMYMMSRGINVDQERMKIANKEIEEKKAQVLEQIIKRCGREINPNSPQDVAAYFYIEKNISPYTKTNAKGEQSWTVDDLALQRLSRGTSSRKGLYEATLIQQYRGLAKLKGTYLDVTLDKDGRFRCSYNPRGTRFSRLSSSKTVFGTGTNAQNLPPEIKTFLTADPGYILIELDKRQAEWVVVAYLSGDENMLQVIEGGKDPHLHTASQIFTSFGHPIPDEVILEESKLIGHSTNPDEIKHIRNGIPFLRDYEGWLPRNMACRQMGKKSNHGLNYREGYKMFALLNEFLEKEAKLIIDEGYHKVYRGIHKWHEFVRVQLKNERVIYDLFGRKYRFLDRFNDELWKAAISCAPQSTVGHLVNMAIRSIYHDTSKGIEYVEMLAQTHDSILFQFPLSCLDVLPDAIFKCKEYLEPTLEANQREFVIATDMKIGFNWRDMNDIPISPNWEDLHTSLVRGVKDLGGSQTE